MKSASIWIAFGSKNDVAPETISPFSRSEATQFIRKLLGEQLRQGRRALVGFDFAYNYPRDFSAALQAAVGNNDTSMPWRTVWDFLRQEIKDDQETSIGRRPNNQSNRFEVANKINALLEGADLSGPFWGAPEAVHPYLPQTRPKQPFQSAQGFLIQSLRFTDKYARSGTAFRLYGTASVGSQTLTGIPRLHELRFDSELGQRSVVWPFETGWAATANWLSERIKIVHAEIYPSVREPLPDMIKDRGQVRSMWEWACELDRQNLLWFEFARPVEIDPGSPEDIAIQLTEGWILGCSPTVRRH